MKAVFRILGVFAIVLLFAAGTHAISGIPAVSTGVSAYKVQSTYPGSIGCYGYFSKHSLPLKLITKIRARAWQDEGSSSWGLASELIFHFRIMAAWHCRPTAGRAFSALAGTWPHTNRLRGPPVFPVS